MSPFRLTQVYLGWFEYFYAYIDLFTLIWACFSSIRSIEVHLNAIFACSGLSELFLFRVIQAPLGLFRHIWAHLDCFELSQGHLVLFRLFRA